ncbi:hypothetical protein PWT90_06470 [Aphanocladium album]|nr:hypothetical protein PWT90_06470 [Aphanocladium album]
MPKAAQRKAASTSEGGRRIRSLERNRIAATKCRRRKNAWQANLESKKDELESRYRALRSEADALTEEVAQLKNLVMSHAFCNDASIDSWIQAQAAAQNLQRSEVRTAKRRADTTSSTTAGDMLQPASWTQLSPTSDTFSTGQDVMSEQDVAQGQDWNLFGMFPSSPSRDVVHGADLAFLLLPLTDTIPPLSAAELESLPDPTAYPSQLQPTDQINPAMLTTSLVGAGLA